MAEHIRGAVPGPFPDGPAGIWGVKRNREIMTALFEQITGDAANMEILEATGQAAGLDVMFDQGMRFIHRDQQRPVLTALASIADGVGIWDRDRIEADKLHQNISASITAAFGFVGPAQREELAQLADAQGRALERSSFQPTESMEAMRQISTDLRGLVKTAGDNIQRNYIDPLAQIRIGVETAREQIIRNGGDDLARNATNSEVVQVLNLVEANPGKDALSQFGLSFGGLGFSSDDIPSMTYNELLNRLQNYEQGAVNAVNGELERRGASVIQAAQRGEVQTQNPNARGNALESVSTAIEGYFNNVTGRDNPPANAASIFAQTVSPALQEWADSLPADARIVVEGDRVVAKTADGKTIAPAPAASLDLAALRARRRNRQTND